MNQTDKKYLLSLIDKLFSGNISKHEVKSLSNFFISHQEFNEWPFEIEGKSEYKEDIYSRIQLEIAKRDVNNTKVVPLYRRNLFKYIAVILLFISAGYFFLTKENTQITEPIIVVNNIKVGTDKATLTLEDGTDIILEKGKSLQTLNANSNGEAIIYKAKEKAPTEIAYNYLTIPRGGEFFIKLSDGTQVWLNSETQLKYPIQFKNGETRTVELVYGEAYFDVSDSSEHGGSKFVVFNKSQEIEVLGTQFNIKAYKDETNIYTTLIEGKVAVNIGGKESILRPTEQANVDLKTNTITVNTADVYKETAWKEGIFSFREKSLSEIMKVLSRWYDFEVEYANQDLKKAGFNGVVRRDKHIEDILEIIKSFGVINNYQIKNKTIILK